MNKQRTFETPDLYLTAAISLLMKTEPSYKVLNGKTFFSFPATDDLYRAVSEYNAGVNQWFEFSSLIKRLRGEAISRRSGASNG